MSTIDIKKRRSHPYQEIKGIELDHEIRELNEIWEKFRIEILDPRMIKDDEIFYCTKSIRKVIIQVDMTKFYYRNFHNDIQLSVLKKTAIYSYWILKLKPFFVNNDAISEKINLTFAIYMLISSLTENYVKNGCLEYLKGDETQPNSDYFKLMLYFFQYNEISLESMMLIFETLGLSSKKKKEK